MLLQHISLYIAALLLLYSLPIYVVAHARVYLIHKNIKYKNSDTTQEDFGTVFSFAKLVLSGNAREAGMCIHARYRAVGVDMI